MAMAVTEMTTAATDGDIEMMEMAMAATEMTMVVTETTAAALRQGQQ